MKRFYVDGLEIYDHETGELVTDQIEHLEDAEDLMEELNAVDFFKEILPEQIVNIVNSYI